MSLTWQRGIKITDEIKVAQSSDFKIDYPGSSGWSLDNEKVLKFGRWGQKRKSE